MRWKAWISGLASMLALVGGCKQRIFMSECDYNEYQKFMPAHLAEKPDATSSPTIDRVCTPPDIYHPEREIRHISLAECISIALEQGTVGNQNVAFANQSPLNVSSDQPVSFNGGRATGPTDSIRVLSLDPAIFGANIENSLSKFDAVWTSSMSWQNTDRPIGTPLDNFQAGSTGINAITQHDATFSTGVIKPLATGGVAGITFTDAYQLTNLPARVNPSYRPALQFQFEQPLLQGFGVEINQLRASHPGSVLTPGVLNGSPTSEGILITRIRFDQQRAEFERLVQNMAVNVELAYWNLYNAYWTLYAREAAMRQAYEAWKISSAKYQAGRVSVADLAQTRGQYELFRGQRIQALNDLLDFERQLRAMLGMHVEDGHRLVPSDTPTLAPYAPDWNTALQEALVMQPFLFEARQEVKAAQLTVIAAKNQLLPDLRFTSTYDINSIGSRMDGSDNDNALRNLASDHFNNWTLGLRLNVPIGFRSAHANLRIARLSLARAYALLQDNELKTERFLAQQFRLMSTYYELIRVNRAQREAFGEQLRARFEEFRAGRGTLDLLLEAQRFWAQALADEYTAIASYNKALAQFEFAKGTILQHDNVMISEGALPGCAQVRAVEHERERTKALVLRERAKPVDHSPFREDGEPSLPQLPDDKAASLPALMEQVQPELPKDANGQIGGLPAAAPANPSDISANSPLPMKPAKPKADPKKPTDFGALRPAGEGKPETIKVAPVERSSALPNGVPNDLPALPSGAFLPPISTK